MIKIPEFNFARDDWVENKILSGKKISELILAELKKKTEKNHTRPGLAVILVGDDPASELYVTSKKKNARSLGFYSELKKLPKDTTLPEIIAQIHDWNQNENIHAILVQLPLPEHIPSNEVLQSIVPEKDVDGFHFQNMGRLFSNEKGIIPCTPLGIAVMLNELQEQISGKNAVIVGRSNIVGKPMAQLLLNYFHCTTTLCHSKTQDISYHLRYADILVAAIGKRDVIDHSDIKKNSIVIDVGIHRTQNGLFGDLNYQEILDKVKYVTPVPGGVGPMTMAMLLYNTYENYLRWKGSLSKIV